jgi:hypothetical protein
MSSSLCDGRLFVFSGERDFYVDVEGSLYYVDMDAFYALFPAGSVIMVDFGCLFEDQCRSCAYVVAVVTPVPLLEEQCNELVAVVRHSLWLEPGVGQAFSVMPSHEGAVLDALDEHFEDVYLGSVAQLRRALGGNVQQRRGSVQSRATTPTCAVSSRTDDGE